ncbi:flagellar motor switch protein FliM [Sphingomonas aracearum]|uniref:Flagellar motor switch protein FliM n=1 Tax=Sphingomonas aracearum TaxID=2283317 RepID=A0A369VXV7_9SPHN|nr:FliM/FliN family flagellar motor switch protein [Sphingomonas aracearum]RDE05902.1 flagellar motor switch protein FliM [Sphingomonas aracearum]
MVNEPSPTANERRERPRRHAESVSLGAANLNPFGDLHSLQHLSARLARQVRGVFEPLLRREVRTWAEPLVVQRFADYRAERPEGLTAWLPLLIADAPHGEHGLCVLDGRFVYEILDLFFGGTGAVPATLPAEFTPAGEALVEKLGALIAAPLGQAWEPLARMRFVPGRVEANPSMLGDFDGEDATVVTRFGIAAGTAKPVFLDILYPVAALKPHAPSLTGKVVSKPAATDPSWRGQLTRAAMTVKFPVRSVLAEPVVSLAMLMDLKPGDVIPISFGAEVPVMVGAHELGRGTVGAANGQAAIRLNSLTLPEELQ